MGKKLGTLAGALLLGGLFACSGAGDSSITSSGGTTSQAGSSSSSGGGSSSSSSGGSSSQAASCQIPDAGKVSDGTVDPANVCLVCDSSRSTNSWSSGAACGLCHANGAVGICDELGNCCTSTCGGNGSCTVADGGQGSPCQSQSDCCNIPQGVCS